MPNVRQRPAGARCKTGPGGALAWKSVRFRAAACDTTTLMRCCPSSLRTSALSGFSVTWSAAAGRQGGMPWVAFLSNAGKGKL